MIENLINYLKNEFLLDIMVGLACFGCGHAGIVLNTEELRNSFKKHP
jgi:hypothetical protein